MRIEISFFHFQDTKQYEMVFDVPAERDNWFIYLNKEEKMTSFLQEMWIN